MKQKLRNIFTKKENIFFIVIIVLVTIICYMFPYISDDMSWGSEIGLERLYNLFKDYNGRYFGNILVIILTRYRILRAIVISLTLVCLTIIITKLTSYKYKYVIIILMLLIPTEITKESIAWTSGFSNYVMPILIPLILINLNKNTFENKTIKINKNYTIPLFVLGIITSLFVEHMTIYNLLLSIYIVIRTYKINKKINLQNLMYLIGSIIGTTIMFSNSTYVNILNSTDTYRKIELSNMLLKMSDSYFNQIYIFYIHNNTLINIILCISSLILLYKKYKTTKKIPIVSSIIVLTYLIYIITTQILKIELITNLDYKRAIEGLIVIEYLISLLGIYSVTIENKKSKRKINFFLLSSLIAILPLTIVSPISYRCFFPSYIFLILTTIEVLASLFESTKHKMLFSLIIMLAIFNYIIYYGNLYNIEHNREEYIKENINKNKIILPKLPIEPEMNNEEELNRKRLLNFKKYYKIPNNTEVEFITYKEWIKKTKNN